MNTIKNKTKKVIPVWIAITIIIIMFTGSVVGMQIYAISIEHVSLFNGQIQSSEFTIISEQTTFHGLNKIVVKLTLSNTDNTNSHSANVTISLLNSNGNTIMNESYLTGIISASNTVSNTTTFTETGIVSSYTSTFVQIMDMS